MKKRRTKKKVGHSESTQIWVDTKCPISFSSAKKNSFNLPWRCWGLRCSTVLMSCPKKYIFFFLQQKKIRHDSYRMLYGTPWWFQSPTVVRALSVLKFREGWRSVDLLLPSNTKLRRSGAQCCVDLASHLLGLQGPQQTPASNDSDQPGNWFDTHRRFFPRSSVVSA